MSLNKAKSGLKAHSSMQTAAEKVFQQYGVQGLLKLTITEQHIERQIRAYGDRPARTEIQTNSHIAGDGR